MTTNLDDAGRDILDMLRILECKMRAKGWEKARARLAMRPTAMDIHLEAANYDVAAFLDPLDCRIRYAFAYGETLSEIFAEADKKIALMLDHPTEALAPWFAVEPEKVAAE